MKNSSQLAISLFCEGMKIDSSCQLEQDGRGIAKRRAGLGSGLEIVILGEKNIWINVPTNEKFVEKSQYLLLKEQDQYFISNGHDHWPIQIPKAPDWYDYKTSSGTKMSRIGVLQGTYLGIYVGKCCHFWRQSPSLACHFCATGINVGIHEESAKSLTDIVETAKAAKTESGVTFVHLNSGYQNDQDIQLILPFVHVLKKQVAILLGVQCIPPLQVESYLPLIEAGVNHFSLCYEFHDSQYFSRYLPGKQKLIGQQRFFNALEYLTKKMPKGSVSGEIIAGIEPVSSTLEAIDYITSLGAFPTVCIFRPLPGTPLENHPTPQVEEMEIVMQYMAKKCIERNIPMGLVPNLEVSLVMTPDDARYLLPHDKSWHSYHRKQRLKKWLTYPYFAWKLR